MTASTAEVCAAYYDAWRRDDFDALRALLADDVEFSGPLGQAHNAEDYLKGVQEIPKTDLVVRKSFVENDDVLTWFDLHTSTAEPVPTATWMQVEGGKIKSVRAIFDPRPLT